MSINVDHENEMLIMFPGGEMKILFLHGLEGSPSGSKAKALKRYANALVPELPTQKAREWVESNPELPFSTESILEPLKVALEAVESFKPDLIVGSSFGGGLAAKLAENGSYNGPLILLAPALKKFGISSLPAASVIIHGVHDDVIPLSESAERTSQDRLLVVDDDHRLKSMAEENSELFRIIRVLDKKHAFSINERSVHV